MTGGGWPGMGPPGRRLGLPFEQYAIDVLVAMFATMGVGRGTGLPDIDCGPENMDALEEGRDQCSIYRVRERHRL